LPLGLRLKSGLTIYDKQKARRVAQGVDHPGFFVWYRPFDGLVIGDTKRSNFIQTPDGQLVPIDIVARFASPEMAESWGYPAPPTVPLRLLIENLRLLAD